MKRDNFIFLLVILIIISFVPLLDSDSITGETITGEVAQTMVMNITVTAGSPSLSLIQPKNETYLNNLSIPLNYSVSGEEWVKYSLDSGTNITITSPIFFNASNGVHTLYLYANNSGGLTIRSVNFSVNPLLFNIIHDKWKGGAKGNSTNFTIFSYQEIQNISDLTIEYKNFGKIQFNEIINLTDDETPSDTEIDLDSYVNVSSNRIKINSTSLRNFNKSATLSLYGLTFSNPRVLKDGSVCPATICIGQVYSGNTLIFNVTGFTVYEAEETPTTPATTPPGGGGTSGGGSATTSISYFTVNFEEIKETIKQGEIITKNIIITNTGDKKLDFEITISGISDLVKISESKFSLEKGNSKIIVLDVMAREDTTPNLYVGKLIVKSGNIQKEILVVIEVESKKALFDIKVEIPSIYNYVLPGEELYSTIDLYNLGEAEKEVDVLLEYKVMDLNGNEILSDSESIAVSTHTSFLKSFKIPAEAQFGKYAVYIRATYNGQTGSASAWFNVGKQPVIPLKAGIIAIISVLVISVLIIYYRIRKLKKPGKILYKINKWDLKRTIKR